MANRLTGLLHARSVRDLAAGPAAETTELDFNIQTGMRQGLEIAAVQGHLDFVPALSTTQGRGSVIQWLDPDGDNPVTPLINVGDGDSFDADVQDRYFQRYSVVGVHDTGRSGFSMLVQPEGLWVPPRQILLARNPAHGVDSNNLVGAGVAILDIWYYWVNLTDSDLAAILSTLG